MNLLKLIFAATAVFFLFSEAEALDKVNFKSLDAQYAEAKSPEAADLLNHTWGFVAVVGNPKLSLNYGASDRVDYDDGLKNPDNSQMYLWFRNDGPQNMFPFLSMDRHNSFSSTTAEFFFEVDQDQATKSVTYAFDAGAHDGTYFLNQCRLSTVAQDQYLLCQAIFKITAQATNPIYQKPMYQEAKDQVVVYQVFKRDLQ